VEGKESDICTPTEQEEDAKEWDGEVTVESEVG